MSCAGARLRPDKPRPAAGYPRQPAWRAFGQDISSSEVAKTCRGLATPSSHWFDTWFRRCRQVVSRLEVALPPSVRVRRALILSILPLVACQGREGRGSRSVVIDTVQGNHVMVRSGEAAMWPRVPWRTRTRRRIGGSAGRPEVMFDVIWDLALDSLGRIYAIDASRTVRVFDTSGTLLRTIGRPGQGPGEISAGIGVEVAPNGRLWVADPGAGRYTVFDTAGRYDTTISRPLFGGAPVSWRGRFVQDGSLLDEDLSFDSGSPTDIVLHLTPSTGRFDSVATLARRIKEFVVAGHSFPRAPIPYAPYATWRADPSGCFWTGYSDRYRITKVCHGDSVLTVERDWHPVVVTSGERDSALARLEWFTRAGGTIDGGRVPGEKTAFVAFWVDATGYLWVRPGVRRDQEGRVLDVFAPTGAYLGPVQLDFTLSRSRGPGVDPPLIVVGPLLVTTTTDSDGVNLIVVADILDRE